MVIHVIGFLTISVLGHQIWKQIIAKIGLVESLVSKVKAFEKYKFSLGLFLDFVYDRSYLGTKNSAWLLDIFWTANGTKFVIGLVIRKLDIGELLTNFIIFWW